MQENNRKLAESLGMPKKYKIVCNFGTFIKDNYEEAKAISEKAISEKYGIPLVELNVDFEEPENFVKLMECEIKQTGDYDTTIFDLVLQEYEGDPFHCRKDFLDRFTNILEESTDEWQLALIKQAIQKTQWKY